MIFLSNRQARQFILLKHGLIGEYKFSGKKGVCDFVRQTGCLQFDPVDVCGRNAELSLQSRVKDFTKDTLNELLYKDRLLVDYPDKQLAIILTEDWAYFERYRRASRENAKHYPKVKALVKQVRDYIRANGAICSSDMKIKGDFHWRSAIHWSGGGNLSRSVLEQMYSSGELIIHHKNGTRKYYDLTERHIPAKILNAPEPFPKEFDHQKWRLFRRIGAVGLLWDRPSDAFLHIWGLDNKTRSKIFGALCEEGAITALSVEGVKCPLYCQSGDIPLVKTALKNPKLKPRCELIAPLDPLLWDRKLIKNLFDFEYTWEIYTPPQKRKYGVYVLPLLFGEQFAGRVEALRGRKPRDTSCTLLVKNVWYEDGAQQSKKLQTMLDACLTRFSKFNGCDVVKRK